MKLRINGVERDFPPIRSLEELLRALDVPVDRGGVAVAHNEEVVPRGRWAETVVSEGDRFEIITAVQGG
ncbi:MAG: sulfur carrier protein ThiS [Candidatus Eisenbacteria bacterium]|nr:sulfur carrier protein ThiS [Candidatus Eisenbacteria bacterium]